MEFVDILDDAMYAGRKLTVSTKARGRIIGTPYSVDEFESDPDRLGYWLQIEPHVVDSVFLDEITGIEMEEPKTTMQEAM